MPPTYSPFHRLAQQLAAQAPVSRLLSRVLRHADRYMMWVSGGRTTLAQLLTGLPIVLVTTTGARSGVARTSALVPIWDISQPQRFALVASNFGQPHLPSWYFNLKKTPRAICRIEGQAATYAAREVTGEEYDRFAALATQTYSGYALYRQRAGRRVPILLMERSKE